MKSFIIILLALLSLVSNKLYGCHLGDKDECCWMNNNGCCKPPKRGQMCTQAFRRCCKRKVYDEKTGKTTIEYY